MRDEDHPQADLAFDMLGSGSAVVPAIWWYEVRNILLVNERRGRIHSTDTIRFLHELAAFTIEVEFPHDESRLIDLARKHKLSFYDAAYLALAMSEHLPLSTLDRDLASAALIEGVTLLV